MTEDIVLIDLFSGVGGFAMGLEQAGFNITHHYFSEIDKNAIAVYKYHFKNAEYVGSVEHVSGTEIRAKHPGARIVVSFGWPCQDNSIAGKRKGHVEGTRSNLLLQAVRIISEAQPDYFTAENVKGLYSVNEGVDFIEAIRLLSYLNSDSPQYNVEQQLLNTLWFLPQNRERTYFVGYPTARGCRQILPVREGNDTINTINTIRSGGRGSLTDKHNWDMVKVGTLRTHKDGEGFREMKDGNCPTIPARAREDGSGMPVICTAVRGRKNKESGITEQQLELGTNTNTNTNTITSVQKDNLIAMRWARNDKGKAARKEAMKNGKDYTPFNGGNRDLVPSENNISGCITNALNKDALVGDFGGDEIRIRRLTEIEVERLQGFPDEWTKYGLFEERPKRKDLLFRESNPELWAYHTKMVNKGDVVLREIAPTQRYKQMGNAVSVPVVKAVGERILNDILWQK